MSRWEEMKDSLSGDYSQGRLILEETEWQLVKSDIDDAREDKLSHAGFTRLVHYDLWDHDKQGLDEAKINFLYMRNS